MCDVRSLQNSVSNLIEFTLHLRRALSTAGYPTNRLPYSSMIIVDPPMMTKEILAAAMSRRTTMLAVIELAKTRKDTWPSREAAKVWLGKRLPWKRWTPQVLDLYVVCTRPSQACAELLTRKLLGACAARPPNGDLPRTEGRGHAGVHARAGSSGLHLSSGRHRQSRAAEGPVRRHTGALHIWRTE